MTWKKGHPGHVAYSDVVDEAICWGWIDSQIRKLDESRSMLLLAPRKKGSGWSRVNKERIERLLAEGRMQPPGMAKIEQAKLDGSWTRLDDIENLVEPVDLTAALNAVQDARRNWDAFPRSARRGILEWIQNAKRPETRAKRIAETARLAGDNVRVLGP